MDIVVRRLSITVAPAEWFSLVYQALRLGLALAGLQIVARFFNAETQPDDLQYPQPGSAGGWQWSREQPVRLAEGAALGWAIALALVLPIVLDGGLRAFFDFSAGAWGRFVLIVLATACGAALRQTVLCGFPFRWLSAAASPALAIALMACFATLSQIQIGRAGWQALLTVFIFQALCCIAALRTGGLWLGWGLDFSARIALGGVFGFPVLGSSLYSSPVLANSAAPAWLTGAEFGPAASVLAPVVVAVAIWALLRMTPIDVIGKIRPGGVAVNLEVHHAKGFEDAAPAAASSLVQIAPPPPSLPIPPQRGGPD